MTLQEELQLRAAHIADDEVLQLLGYRRPTAKNRQRLHDVLNDPQLGLDGSAFDFRYSNRDFIQTLASVLGIDSAIVNSELRRIIEQIERAQAEFVPSIFVDTDFKRTTQPLFALAVCEHQRTIFLSETERDHYRQLTMAERIPWIGNKIRAHYQELEGRLGIWGMIQRYVYHYDPESALVMRPDGSIEKEVQPQAPPSASLSLKGKKITLHRESADD